MARDATGADDQVGSKKRHACDRILLAPQGSAHRPLVLSFGDMVKNGPATRARLAFGKTIRLDLARE